MICFEITETVAISNMLESVDFIKGIRAAGCKIALDDFGSGLSSFSYLKAIPADFLKIDGSFMRNLASNEENQAMVKSISEVANAQGNATIAEFVEDASSLAILWNVGVNYIQGYFLQKPSSTITYEEEQVT